TVTTDCINLINKDNTWCMTFCLFEHVTHTRCTNTHKHFHEVRTRNTKEWHFRFTGNGFGKQGFTCTWRTDHQNTTWNTSTETFKFGWVFQEVDNFNHFLLGFITTGNIDKSDFNLVFRQHFDFRFTKTHWAVFTTCTATHVAHKEHE